MTQTIDHALLMAAAATSGFSKSADNTWMGAGIGAGIGALGMGAKRYLQGDGDAGDVARDALIGAGLGGVAGAGAGHVMDRGNGSFTAGLKNISDNFSGTAPVSLSNGRSAIPADVTAVQEAIPKPPLISDRALRAGEQLGTWAAIKGGIGKFTKAKSPTVAAPPNTSPDVYLMPSARPAGSSKLLNAKNVGDAAIAGINYGTALKDLFAARDRYGGWSNFFNDRPATPSPQ